MKGDSVDQDGYPVEVLAGFALLSERSQWPPNTGKSQRQGLCALVL